MCDLPAWAAQMDADLAFERDARVTAENRAATLTEHLRLLREEADSNSRDRDRARVELDALRHELADRIGNQAVHAQDEHVRFYLEDGARELRRT